MAMTFPASAAQFFDGLRIRSMQFYDDQPMDIKRLASGAVIPHSLGATLWKGQVTVAPAYNANAVVLEAKLSVLRRPGSSFLVYDNRQNGPAADPGGVVLGSATPTIHTIAANNREMRVTGLPAGYVLSAGDMIGFQYGSNPVRYALHRLVSGAVASGGGLTPLFEVTPAIRAGAAVSAPVQLVRPVCKAILLPSASYGASELIITQGASFEFIQVLGT